MWLDQQFVLDIISMDERFLFAKSCFLLWDLLATCISVMLSQEQMFEWGENIYLLLFLSSN